jgi:hypothetical protein
MKLPALTYDDSLFFWPTISGPQMLLADGGVAPSLNCSDPGPCVNGMAVIQCCDASGCRNQYVPCSAAMRARNLLSSVQHPMQRRKLL